MDQHRAHPDFHWIDPPGRCRWCGRISFLANERGPAHPCCEARQSYDCEACNTSAALARQWDRYGRQHAQRKADYWKENA